MSGQLITNWEPTDDGQVRAICQWCDRRSHPVEPARDGRPDFWGLGRGWSEAPYSVDFVQLDGSRGSQYTCPDCRALADERQCAGIRPLLSPSPARAAAIAARRATRPPNEPIRVTKSSRSS